jgi:hypothetical protein
LVRLARLENQPTPFLVDDLADDGILEVAMAKAFPDLRHDAGKCAVKRD